MGTLYKIGKFGLVGAICQSNFVQMREMRIHISSYISLPMFSLHREGILTKYGKIPIISPGLIFVQKAVFGAYFRGSLFSEGLIIGRNFAF